MLDQEEDYYNARGKLLPDEEEIYLDDQKEIMNEFDTLEEGNDYY
jgi:hypothetical protein